MRTIVCSCNATFTADLPESIDLDENPAFLQELQTGNFMSVVCPTCGRKLKPEIPLIVQWPSKGLRLRVIPELDLMDEESAGGETFSVVVGYPELAERVAVVAAGLEPMAVEALKYYLLLKASEADPNAETSAWFYSLGPETIDFHVHGLRSGEVAVSRVPRSLYERTLAESKSRPDEEPFSSLKKGNRVSVRNLLTIED